MQRFSVIEKLNDHCARSLLGHPGLREFMQCANAADTAEQDFVRAHPEDLFKYAVSELTAIPVAEPIDLQEYTPVVDQPSVQKRISGFSKAALKQCESNSRLMYHCYNPVKLARFVELVIWKRDTTEAYRHRRHFVSSSSPAVIRRDPGSMDTPKLYFFTGPELIWMRLAHEGIFWFVEGADWLIEKSFPNLIEFEPSRSGPS